MHKLSDFDKGHWKVHVDGQVYVCSDDFEHDVWLIVTGDFETPTQKEWYAQCIADKLNGET